MLENEQDYQPYVWKELTLVDTVPAVATPWMFRPLPDTHHIGATLLTAGAEDQEQ